MHKFSEPHHFQKSHKKNSKNPIETHCGYFLFPDLFFRQITTIWTQYLLLILLFAQHVSTLWPWSRAGIDWLSTSSLLTFLISIIIASVLSPSVDPHRSLQSKVPWEPQSQKRTSSHPMCGRMPWNIVIVLELVTKTILIIMKLMFCPA